MRFYQTGECIRFCEKGKLKKEEPVARMSSCKVKEVKMVSMMVHSSFLFESCMYGTHKKCVAPIKKKVVF